MTDEQITYEVDPSRLSPGQWCHDRQRQIGRGDITASYSADTIGMEGRIRKPFSFHSRLWVCVGRIADEVRAYSLVLLSEFNGKATVYAEKTRDGEAARHDPLGFYHGMTVRSGRLHYVLSGPPVHFIPGRVEQLELF